MSVLNAPQVSRTHIKCRLLLAPYASCRRPTGGRMVLLEPLLPWHSPMLHSTRSCTPRLREVSLTTLAIEAKASRHLSPHKCAISNNTAKRDCITLDCKHNGTGEERKSRGKRFAAPCDFTSLTSAKYRTSAHTAKAARGSRQTFLMEQALCRMTVG